MKKFNKYLGDTGYIIPINVFKDTYKTLFGSELLEADIMDDYIDECPFYGISEDKENVAISDMCGDNSLPNILTEIVKYDKMINNNEINIYEIVGYPSYLGEVGANDGDLLKLFSDEKKTNLVAYEFELDKDKLIDYKDKLPMYKYTFKYNDNGDGNDNYEDYYFYSVEKVK